jgi:hypothetical protein
MLILLEEGKHAKSGWHVPSRQVGQPSSSSANGTTASLNFDGWHFSGESGLQSANSLLFSAFFKF